VDYSDDAYPTALRNQLNFSQAESPEEQVSQTAVSRSGDFFFVLQMEVAIHGFGLPM